MKSGEVFIFDLFKGKSIHTTELLESPLKNGNHTVHKKMSRIEILILNDYDLISSKLMRGSGADFEDCLELLKAHKDKIDFDVLHDRFNELVKYDISTDRLKDNLDILFKQLNKGKKNG